MITDENRRIYRQAMTRYGIVKQTNQTVQELGECIMACTKYLQKIYWAEPVAQEKFNKYMDNLAEEIADVQIMTEQLTDYHGIEDQVARWKEQKIQRLVFRMAGGDAHGKKCNDRYEREINPLQERKPQPGSSGLTEKIKEIIQRFA
jgi:NTP pyrophosphatase (non-canonical NTP hydrolase)